MLEATEEEIENLWNRARMDLAEGSVHSEVTAKRSFTELLNTILTDAYELGKQQSKRGVQ